MGARAARRTGFPAKAVKTTSKYRDKKSHTGHQVKEGYGEFVPAEPKGKPFRPSNEKQRCAVSSILANDLTFLVGPAGTGKTHCAIAGVGIPFLHKAPDNRLILLNPGVELGQELGTLPGDKNDKIAVSSRPLRDILNKSLGSSHVDNLEGQGKIIFEHLGSVLGVTYDDCIIVLDEAQNATPAQMSVLLKRVGHRSKIILAGDHKEQTIIPGLSGLEDALNRLEGQPGVGVIEFGLDDVVRSDFCRMVIQAYRQERCSEPE